MKKIRQFFFKKIIENLHQGKDKELNIKPTKLFPQLSQPYKNPKHKIQEVFMIFSQCWENLFVPSIQSSFQVTGKFPPGMFHPGCFPPEHSPPTKPGFAKYAVDRGGTFWGGVYLEPIQIFQICTKYIPLRKGQVFLQIVYNCIVSYRLIVSKQVPPGLARFLGVIYLVLA